VDGTPPQALSKDMHTMARNCLQVIIGQLARNPYMSNYAFTPYVTGPTSAHVLWARMSANGGLMGGEGGIYAYTNGGMTGTFTCTPNMIYNGRCYQTVTKVMPTLVNGTYINIPTSVWQCYDLYTGAIYWEQTGVPGATMWIQEQALPEVAGGGSNYPGTDQSHVCSMHKQRLYDKI